MVKHKPQASQAPETEGKVSTGHPLLNQMLQTDAFAEAAQKRKEAKEFQIAELETWKATVQALAQSPDGQLFIKSLVQHSGMFSSPHYKDTLKMVDVRLKSAFYLDWVRPFLTPDMRKDIE
jgi:hypothetical protein